MLDRLSVSVLLKTVITTLAAIAVILLAMGARDSWTRYAAAGRTAAVAQVSAHLFAALHNLRVDFASTVRDLNHDQVLTAMKPSLRQAREGEMPALKSALTALAHADFPERDAAIAALDQSIRRLAALHEETAAAMLKPKAERRPGLAQEFGNDAKALSEMLDKLATRLAALVRLQDALVDHLLDIKQLAWLARSGGGDASVMISNILGGAPTPPDAMLRFTSNMSKLETSFKTLEDVSAALILPPRFTEAVQNAKRDLFENSLNVLMTNTIKALMAGQKPDITSDQWAGMTLPKLGSLLRLAEISLDVAKEHAATERTKASWRLGVQVGLLITALLFAAGMMLMVSRRVTGPLRTIQDAMLKLAAGDLSAEVSFGNRRDEIGGLASAMQAFKTSMIDADRLRAEQKDSEARASAQRREARRKLADEFHAAVGGIVDMVSSSSSQLEAAAGTLTRNAETTLHLSGVVASASEEASANVRSVAVATEEMTSSVNEIARQVQDSSRIATEAVKQAEQTDRRIGELSSAASRIGDVVKLITAIAEQTNLLALNATIEAARAGEAGRGFAIVAQEVKALAAQTAKATDEIGTQISSMQTATQDSVAAIKEISGTITRVSEIASAITAAVEEQGATTQEISRNVQQAAKGTAEVAANISDVNRGAGETGSASSQVLGSAQALARESGRLKAEVEKFVATVRAA